jgi:hypothetical protein
MTFVHARNLGAFVLLYKTLLALVKLTHLSTMSAHDCASAAPCSCKCGGGGAQGRIAHAAAGRPLTTPAGTPAEAWHALLAGWSSSQTHAPRCTPPARLREFRPRCPSDHAVMYSDGCGAPPSIEASAAAAGTQRCSGLHSPAKRREGCPPQWGLGTGGDWGGWSGGRIGGMLVWSKYSSVNEQARDAAPRAMKGRAAREGTRGEGKARARGLAAGKGVARRGREGEGGTALAAAAGKVVTRRARARSALLSPGHAAG